MRMSLCQTIAIICVLSVGFMTVTPFIPNAQALPSAVVITEIYEKCYLIGYPRTYCGSRSYTVQSAQYDHPVGDEEHTVDLIYRRESRTRNVYTSCSDCDS